MDDEAAVRTVMGRTLDPYFRVLLAAGGKEALQMCQMGLGISAVVTDIRMPGMDGVTLAECLARRGLHHARLVYFRLRPRRPYPGPFLRKPFTPEALVAAVQQLLGGPYEPQRVQ